MLQHSSTGLLGQERRCAKLQQRTSVKTPDAARLRFLPRERLWLARMLMPGLPPPSILIKQSAPVRPGFSPLISSQSGGGGNKRRPLTKNQCGLSQHDTLTLSLRREDPLIRGRLRKPTVRSRLPALQSPADGAVTR